MRLAGYTAGIKNALVRNPDYLENLGGRWVDNIKVNLKEIEWRGVNWSGLTENRGEWSYFVNMVTNLQGL